VGNVPEWMLSLGAKTEEFFVKNGSGMLTLVEPKIPIKNYFEGNSMREFVLRKKYKTNITKDELNNERLVRLELLSFLNHTLTIDPRQRVSIYEAADHPFVNNFNIEKFIAQDKHYKSYFKSKGGLENVESLRRWETARHEK